MISGAVLAVGSTAGGAIVGGLAREPVCHAQASVFACDAVAGI